MKDKIDLLISNLKKRTFIPHVCKTKEEAIELCCSLIPASADVGIGGSMTIAGMGLAKILYDRGNTVYSAGFTNLPPDEIYKKAQTTEFYLSSTNAICTSGELVNIDGRGNRLSSFIYGHPNVIVIAGINKITDSIDDAIHRVRNVATPKNCVRLNKKTPCAVTGTCHKCYPPETICRSTVITHFPPNNTQFHIILVEEELGY